MSVAAPGQGLGFSLVQGGPFHTLLGRLGLTAADHLPTIRGVIVLAGLAWVPLAALVILQSLLSPSAANWSFFADATAYSRYLVAVPIMVATERYADGRLTNLLDNFRRSRLVADASLARFAELVARADRRSASWRAEAIILLLAWSWAGLVTNWTLNLAGVDWDGRAAGDGFVLTWAGIYQLAVSSPLFIFLVFRWVWRFMVWTALLAGIARLDLRLNSHNPDRAAGLGFMTVFPQIFLGFIFAISCVVATAMIKEIHIDNVAADDVWLAMAAWIVICVFWFIGPLMVFVLPLNGAQEKAILDFSRISTLHHLDLEERLGEVPERDADSRHALAPDFSVASGLNSLLQSVNSQRLAPVSAATVKLVVLAAALPLIPVVLTLVPFFDLVRWLFGKVV